jgi:hypothetical protein
MEVIMSEGKTNNKINGDRGIRHRFRGFRESKTGKVAGYTSLAAPVVGFIINDLRKPDSLIRQLIGKTLNRLLDNKYKKVEAIDITDKVEVLSDTDNNKLTGN